MLPSVGRAGGKLERFEAVVTARVAGQPRRSRKRCESERYAGIELVQRRYGFPVCDKRYVADERVAHEPVPVELVLEEPLLLDELLPLVALLSFENADRNEFPCARICDTALSIAEYCARSAVFCSAIRALKLASHVC